jgi:PAS domain S-box-containing protein
MKAISKLQRYGLAVISCGLAVVVAKPLDAPSSCFFLAVMLSNLYGGKGPGLLCVGLSALCFAYFFLPPRFELHPDPYLYLRFAAFLGATLLISALMEKKRRVEESRRQVDAYCRTITDTAADAIVSIDREGRILFINPAATTIFGWAASELIGQPLTILTPNFRLTDRLSPVELIGRRKDGTEFSAEVSFGEVAGRDQSTFTGFVRDITERKRAEEQLKRSESYLAESQRMSHLGSWAVHISPRELVFWSQENYRLWGFDPVNGIPSFEAVLSRIHPEDRRNTDEAFESAVREQRDFTSDFRIIFPDGTMKYFYNIGHPVVDQNGDVVEFLGTVMDVTERKRAEEELRKSHGQLRALAARLQTVREEERTRVAREIHDELGQALTAIKIDLTALVRELLADKGPAVQRSQSILKLVDDAIESVQRIATDLRPGILDDLGLAAAVEWAAEEFEARTGTKCRVSVPGADIAVHPECATALFRILQETLTNVARHAHATEVNVKLAKDNGDLSLEVQDNGQGIGEEQLAAGRSLGILGMRERALLLGGDLTIRSAPGKGTTVRVRIPDADCKQPVQAK